MHAMVHGWVERCIAHRIADRRIVRRIQQWVNAGVLEDGKPMQREGGSPQGASFRPWRPTSPSMRCLIDGLTSGVDVTVTVQSAWCGTLTTVSWAR